MVERLQFIDQLRANWDQGKFVCVGLDADYDRLPPHLLEPNRYEQRRLFAQERFLTDIIAATADLVCAFKPNIAFFEDHQDGEDALVSVVGYIHSHYPNVPVIGDIKRADIGNTNKGYAKMAFERYEFDAITTNPYFGHDTYPPFLSNEGRGLIVLCKTTNPGAAFYQDAPIVLEHYNLQQKRNGTPLTQEEYKRLMAVAVVTRSQLERELFGSSTVPLYWIVAARTATLAKENQNVGLVVGATHPQAFKPVRYLAMDTPFLIPGIGTQGGDLEKTLRYAPDSRRQGMIINSASKILFASSGHDFAQAARAETLALHNQILELRAKLS